MLSLPTDKLLKPPQGGGKSKEKSDFRSAERCLTSLSKQIPAIPMKFPEEDMVFIGKPDRLLGYVMPSAPITRTSSDMGETPMPRLPAVAGGTGVSPVVVA